MSDLDKKAQSEETRYPRRPYSPPAVESEEMLKGCVLECPGTGFTGQKAVCPPGDGNT